MRINRYVSAAFVAFVALAFTLPSLGAAATGGTLVVAKDDKAKPDKAKDDKGKPDKAKEDKAKNQEALKKCKEIADPQKRDECVKNANAEKDKKDGKGKDDKPKDDKKDKKDKDKDKKSK